MNKLKQILEFIRALLGFLLNLKKKKTDEKNEKPARPIPGKLPDDTPSDSIGIVSGRPRDCLLYTSDAADDSVVV